MDSVQLSFIAVLSVLTVLAVFLGIQVFFILKELRGTVSRVNKILDDAGTISESIAEPVSSLSTLTSGIKAGVSLLSLFIGKKSKGENDGE